MLAPVLAQSGWAQAGCPVNTLSCWGGGTTTSNLPQGSCNTGQSSANYDAAKGTVDAQVCCWLGGAGVTVADSFVVSGVQPDVPLTFRATLQAYLCTSARSSGSATITGPDGASRTAGASSGSCQTYLLDLTIQATVDQQFALSYRIGGGVTERGQFISHGQLVFQDVPPGAAIRSCHGFAQDVAVPTRSASWGRVKVLYR